MSDRPLPLKLLLVDSDSIYRLGLRVALEEVPNLQVVSEAQTDTAALQILAELAENDPTRVNLLVLELGNNRSTHSQQLSLQLCRQLKTQYPNLPVFLLSAIQDQGILSAARATGVNGYSPKGTPVSELIAAWELVASGGVYWDGEVREVISERQLLYAGKPVHRTASSPLPTPHSPLPTPNSPLPFLNNLRLSGITQIDADLAQVTAQLQVPGLPLLDRAVLAGKRRELLAARWLVNKILPSPQHESQNIAYSQLPPLASPQTAITKLDAPQPQNYPSLLSPRALQARLFSACVAKLQLNLQNVTDVPLEIDILRPEKKRELLYLILQKVANALDEMRASRLENNKLIELQQSILFDILQSANQDFFGKFSTVRIGNQNLEIVNILQQDTGTVQIQIIEKIPLVAELFSYLLFQTNLQIDNTSYPAGSFEANERAEMLLENLLIQIANGVVSPLLNSLANVEEIKQIYYDRQLISTREIERFRNNLSWKYRLSNYITEPKAIFESRYDLFVFAPRGIAKIAIYASRSQELGQLSGVGLVVTLVLEFADAIAPRLKSLLSLLGSGVVFILTKVIGRGLGLIGRGILQGIGNVSLSEKNWRRKE